MVNVEDVGVSTDKCDGEGDVKVPDDGLGVVLLDGDLRNEGRLVIQGPQLQNKNIP